jgi:hypothetical protein
MLRVPLAISAKRCEARWASEPDVADSVNAPKRRNFSFEAAIFVFIVEFIGIDFYVFFIITVLFGI